jgi:hypothetical protein
MTMWLIALALMCVALVAIFGVPALKRMKVQSAWKEADANDLAELAKGSTSSSNGDSATEGAEEAIAAAETNAAPRKELWVDSNYYWVVVCKNHWFHRHPNIFNVHRIPLGQTDAVLGRPTINRPFAARCDECRKEYIYKPSEVLRYEMDDVASDFVPHPMFRD